MTLAQVERSDTIEIQRQKINLLVDQANRLSGYSDSPKDLQVIREDFNVINYMYDPALTPFSYQPSPYFRYRNDDANANSSGEFTIYSGGLLSLKSTVTDIGGSHTAAISARNHLNPVASTDYVSFETRVALQNDSGSDSAKMIMSAGFTTALYLVDSSTNPRSKYGVFFEITAPSAPAAAFSSPTLRAVVVNDQSPTPAVIFDQLIAGSHFGNLSNPQYATLKIVATRSSVTFYLNGESAALFTTTNFALAAYLTPFVHVKNFEDGGYFAGTADALVDYISVQNKITR